MAIVLLIAAIIGTGAMIAGRGVLARARLADLLANIKDLATASRDFKTRYAYFPGDLPNAGTYITSNGGISAGCIYAPSATAGNGIVDTSTESDCGLEHLLKAGLLTKLDYDSANGKYIIASPVGDGVRVFLSVNTATNENVVKISNLPCDVALEIDRKFDSTTTDNTPFLGGAVIAHGSVSTTVAGVTTTNPDAPIPTCTSGGGAATYDPVPTLMIRY